MDNTLVVKEVALCARTRCPLLIFQLLACGEQVAIPIGLVEACLVGCVLHEGGVGAERCKTFLATALEEADGDLVAIEIGRMVSGEWWAEMVFRRGDGSTRRYRRRPADAATMAVAFGVPLTLGRWKEGPKGSDDLTPGKIARWLATLSPADFEGLGEEPSGGSPPS